MISRLPQGFSTRCLRFVRDVAADRARLASGWLVGHLPGEGSEALDRLDHHKLCYSPRNRSCTDR